MILAPIGDAIALEDGAGPSREVILRGRDYDSVERKSLLENE